jgi:putative transposase
VLLSYRYRIEPNKTQAIALSDMLGDFCQLYNAALEQRITAYKQSVQRHGKSTAKGVTNLQQQAELPAMRRDLPHIGRWSATAEQMVLRKLDKSYKAFFGRVKRGAKAGFPRFKSRDRYHAADFRVGDGLTIKKNGKLGFVGVPGEIKVRWHRDMPSKPKSAILSRNAGKWYIIFHVEVASVDRAGPGSVGIDMGLTTLAALSTGELIERRSITKRNARKLRIKQRALARCKRGSKRRRKAKAAVAKLQAHIGNARRDYLHKVSSDLVARFGRIAIEKLNVKGLAGGMLAKSVHDASWAQLAALISYKAANAGCEIVMVDPRGTSQTCPVCGTIKPKTLATREHRCSCGCTLDRDVAAAIVIHQRAFGSAPGVGVGSLSLPVAA